jgi:hypothetical protein
MLAELITLTSGRQNHFIDCHHAKVHIAVGAIMDVKMRWNSRQESLKWVYQLGEFICKWLQNPKYTEHWPVFTPLDEWTIVMHVMEVLSPF